MPAALKTVVLAKPAISDSLKEARDKDSSLAAALKPAVFNQMPPKSAILYLYMQSRVLPIFSKRPEIRIPAWRQLSKRRFSPDASQKCYFVLNMQSRAFPSLFQEARNKDSSLAAALKTAIFNQMLSKMRYLVLQHAKPWRFRFSQRGPR